MGRVTCSRCGTLIRELATFGTVPSLQNTQQAVFEGEKFVKNAKDAIDQTVKDEEDLYIWENQLAAIDEFLADTEDMEGNGDLEEVRAQARECKEELEACIAEFFGDPVDADDPEESIAALLDVGRQLIEEAETVMDKQPDRADLDEHANEIETSLIGLKQWLADSEPYHDEHEFMAAARSDIKMTVDALEHKLGETVKAWKSYVEEMEDD